MSFHAPKRPELSWLRARARALATFLAQAASHEAGPGRVARYSPLFYRPLSVCLIRRSPGIESHVIARQNSERNP